MNSRERDEGVRILRLVTGELIMGSFTVKPNIEGIVFMKDVLQLVEVPQQNGQGMGLGMMPFMPFAKQDGVFEITVNNIVTNVEPVDKLLAEYQGNFGKVITPAKPDLIAPGK